MKTKLWELLLSTSSWLSALVSFAGRCISSSRVRLTPVAQTYEFWATQIRTLYQFAARDEDRIWLAASASEMAFFEYS